MRNDTWCLVCRERCGSGSTILNGLFAVVGIMFLVSMSTLTVILLAQI